MGDSLITIIAIFLAAILMFVFPLMSLSERTDDISQLAVVPLAIPMTIGPGTTGILLLMGASFNDISNFITESLALLSAVLVIGLMLFSSTLIEAIVGKEGLQVISKITGLFLAALSAQIMFTGVKNFLGI